MKNAKIERLLAAFCWCGTAIVLLLMGYMLHLVKEYPTVETFAHDVRIIGVLLLVWTVVSTFFTVRACRSGKKRDK